MEAVVDRVQLMLTLQKATQAHALRRHLPEHWKKPYVLSMAGQASHTDTQFTVWIQDPGGPDSIQHDLDTIADKFSFSAPIEICGVEVAIDLYLTGEPTSLSFDGVTQHLIKSHARPPSSDSRITWRDLYPSGAQKPRFKAAVAPREIREHLLLGHSVQSGELNADDRSRYYIKRQDTVEEGQYLRLPEAEHRPRYERTLTGGMCPFSTIDAWKGFRFETLARLFALRLRDRTPATPLISAMAPWMRLGRVEDDGKRLRHMRVTARGTRADARANSEVRDALRRLTSVQRGTSRNLRHCKAARA